MGPREMTMFPIKTYQDQPIEHIRIMMFRPLRTGPYDRTLFPRDLSVVFERIVKIHVNNVKTMHPEKGNRVILHWERQRQTLCRRTCCRQGQ